MSTKATLAFNQVSETCMAVYLHGNTPQNSDPHGYFYTTPSGLVTFVEGSNGYPHTYAGTREKAIDLIVQWDAAIPEQAPDPDYEWKYCTNCRQKFETCGETMCFECKTAPAPTSKVWDMSKQEQNRLIREGLKRIDPLVSVTSGKGTASFWVHVRDSEKVSEYLRTFHIYGNIAPGERELVIFKLFPELGNLGDMEKARRSASNERERWD